MLPARAPHPSTRRRQRGRFGPAVAAIVLLLGLLAPAGVSAVTSTISGKVTNSGGTALAGIKVQPGTISASAFTAVGASTTTAANGTYSVSVGTGKFALRFSDPALVYAMGFYSTGGFVVDAPSASTILSTGATVTGVNVHLPLAHSITGHVTNASSTALVNITVEAFTTAGIQIISTKTNASGDYDLHVASGSYVIKFTDPAKVYPSGYYTPTGLVTDIGAATVVAVSAANVTGKDIVLPASKHIAGTVTDASAAAVAGITVSAGLATATTNASGAYSLSVPPGSYVVTVQDLSNALPSGYYTSGGTGLTTSLSSATHVNVSAADASGIDVQLPTGASVSGTVTGSGAPRPGIDVWLLPIGAIDPLTVVTTNASGQFGIKAAPGTFVLKFVDNSGAFSAGFYKSGATGAFTKDLASASNVVVSGSAIALSSVTLPAYNAAVRQSGADRFATAAAISRAATPSGVSVVYIATGANYPDALAAAAVAAHLGGPVLLVTRDSIPAATRTELTRLKPDRIVVAGGPSVVSSAVMTALDTYTTGPVERQSGTDRYATAASISSHTFAPGAPVAYIATGLNFPDALAAAAVAGRLDGPVLLVTTSAIPTATQAELNRLKPDRIVVAGGTAVVSNGS